MLRLGAIVTQYNQKYLREQAYIQICALKKTLAAISFAKGHRFDDQYVLEEKPVSFARCATLRNMLNQH